MEYHQIADRVKSFQEHAARDRKGYYRRVFWWVVLGYCAYIAFLALSLLTLLLGLALLAIPPAIVAGIIFSLGAAITLWKGIGALFVRFDAPSGVHLTREEAPRLFELVDDLEKRVGADKIQSVILNNDFNASAAQMPRFGAIGKPQNVLLIGLPMFDCMKADHIRSVLAHEFGHFFRQHGSFPGWVERQRTAWQRLYSHSQQSGHKARLMTRFLTWYAPRLDIASYVLIREREFEADQTSVDYVNSRAVADSLVSTYVAGKHIPAIIMKRWKTALRAGALDTASMAASMLDEVKQRIAEDGKSAFSEAEWKAEADYSDTHPTIAARLAGMGYVVKSPDDAEDYITLPATHSDSASSEFFGSQEDAIRGKVGVWFVEDNRETFASQLPGHQAGIKVLDKLESMPVGSLPWYTRLERFVIRATLDLEWKGAEAEMDELVKVSEGRDEVLYHAAMFFAEQEDWSKVVELLSQIGPYFDAENHNTVYYVGCHALRMLGRESEIPEYEKRISKLEPHIKYNQQLNPVGSNIMTAELVEPWRRELLVEALAAIPEITNAWVVDMDLRPNAGPYRYLLVQRKRKFMEVSDSKLDAQIGERVSAFASFLGISYVMIDNPRYFKAPAKAIKGVPGAKLEISEFRKRAKS